MSDLDKLQRAERAIRARHTQMDRLGERRDWDYSPVIATQFECDCICHCGTIVTGMKQPTKGTTESMCMTCLSEHQRQNSEHQPWPVSRVVILPPEKKP